MTMRNCEAEGPCGLLAIECVGAVWERRFVFLELPHYAKCYLLSEVPVLVRGFRSLDGPAIVAQDLGTRSPSRITSTRRYPRVLCGPDLKIVEAPSNSATGLAP